MVYTILRARVIHHSVLINFNLLHSKYNANLGYKA